MLIERNDDRQRIGSVVYFYAHPLYSSLEIGYGIDDPALRGKGYGHEAVKLLLNYLF